MGAARPGLKEAHPSTGSILYTPLKTLGSIPNGRFCKTELCPKWSWASKPRSSGNAKVLRIHLCPQQSHVLLQGSLRARSPRDRHRLRPIRRLDQSRARWQIDATLPSRCEKRSNSSVSLVRIKHELARPTRRVTTYDLRPACSRHGLGALDTATSISAQRVFMLDRLKSAQGGAQLRSMGLFAELEPSESTSNAYRTHPNARVLLRTRLLTHPLSCSRLS